MSKSFASWATGLQRPQRSLFALTIPKKLRPEEAHRTNQHVCLYASSSSSKASKPPVLEKPARFNPPSHPQRIVRAPRNYPGPKLTHEEQTVRATKRYPHTFPNENTFMHWFLTNKGVHVWISLSVLISLAVFTMSTSFRRSSYYELMPRASEFVWHPLASLSQSVDLFKMYTAQVSAETAEKRKQQIEEAQKRRAYRIAHGLESADAQGIQIDGVLPPKVLPAGVGDDSGSVVAIEGADTAVEGPVRRPVKKWFGIW